MYQLRRSTRNGHEDLMRELELIEQKVLKADSSLGMDLMVLDAKIRERFQCLERLAHVDERTSTSPGWSADDLQALIPRDVALFPTVQEIETSRSRKMWETVGTAALLAVFTALGVFGLASILQLSLSWLA